MKVNKTLQKSKKKLKYFISFRKNVIEVINPNNLSSKDLYTMEVQTANF